VKAIEKLLSSPLVVLLLLFVIGEITYFNAIPGGFIWDEYGLILNNEAVRNFDFWHFFVSSPNNMADGLYRPLLSIVNSITFQIFGFNAWGYHILPILLHILNSYLIFRIFTRVLKFKNTPSFLGALIYLVHPLQTESVAYIAGLPEPMGTLWVLLGMILFTDAIHLKKGSAKIWKSIGAISMFVLALLSKESMIVMAGLVVLFTIYLWPQLKKPTRKSALYLSGVFAGMAALYLFLKFSFLYFSEEILMGYEGAYNDHMWVRLVTFCHSMWEYTVLMLYPIHLYFEKPYIYFTSLLSFKGIAGLLIILGSVTVGLWSLFKKDRKLFLAIFWFFCAMSPYVGIFPVNAMLFDHWLYLPMVGLMMLIPIFYERIKKQQVAVFVLICLLATAFVGRTILRNQEWADPELFFENELYYDPGSSRAHNVFASYYYLKGDTESAIIHYKKSIEIEEERFGSWSSLANIYVLEEDWANALAVHSAMLFVWPDLDFAYELVIDIHRANDNHVLADAYQGLWDRHQAGEELTREDLEEVLLQVT
jgi:protein O-mannosyl-transferase